MAFLNSKSFFLCCFLLALIRFESVEFDVTVWSTIATLVNRGAIKLVAIIAHPYAELVGITLDPLTTDLCKRNTDQLIEYYGYKSEVHNVMTNDGYRLTVFRCNSNKTSVTNKKAVILQHGLLASSDDFTVNIPSQGLAYVLADLDYDVWMPNSRGSYYSQEHVKFTTIDPQFWNFSFYDIAIYDYPAVIDYVRHETGNDKVFIVAHSQGTTTLMALLSEIPRYNQYVAAASFLAPVGYLNHSGYILTTLSRLSPFLNLFKYTEFLPRTGLSAITKSFCSVDVVNICGHFIDYFYGQSMDQRNDTMMTAFLCKVPSGASTMQIIQFGQEVNYGFFGKYMYSSEVPEDFDLSLINIPLSLHYSTIDKFTNPIDVNRLISKLNHTLAFVQTIESPQFNHMDFVWGKTAVSIVYSKIIDFFAKYQ